MINSVRGSRYLFLKEKNATKRFPLATGSAKQTAGPRSTGFPFRQVPQPASQLKSGLKCHQTHPDPTVTLLQLAAVTIPSPLWRGSRLEVRGYATCSSYGYGSGRGSRPAPPGTMAFFQKGTIGRKASLDQSDSSGVFFFSKVALCLYEGAVYIREGWNCVATLIIASSSSLVATSLRSYLSLIHI